MSIIKDTIEKLAREWSWSAVNRHPLRSKLVSDRRFERRAKKGFLGGMDVIVEYPGADFSSKYSIRYEKDKGDFRIWTKNNVGLIQWRTSKEKGDRLVYRPFAKNITVSERVEISEIFLDPFNVNEGEVEMFEMIYPDISPLIPGFNTAVQMADQELIEMFGR